MADTHFPPLKREALLEEELPAANPIVRLIKGARIRFAPGQPTGLHRHPVPRRNMRRSKGCLALRGRCVAWKVRRDGRAEVRTLADLFPETAAPARASFTAPRLEARNLTARMA
jgi:hypothetical protein